MVKIENMEYLTLVEIIAPKTRNMSSSEFRKLSAACRAKQEKKRGFEGCSDPDCNFDGYYLCTYSKEGLCSDCEQEQFPDRYIGCLFCRNPCKVKNYVCLTCSAAFDKWIKNNAMINVTDTDNVSNWTLQFNREMARHSILNSMNSANHSFIAQENKGFYDWPGFYRGDNKWEIIDVPFTVDVTLNELEDHECMGHKIVDKLAEHGINLYSEIQITR